jgi:hypothetical protein
VVGGGRGDGIWDGGDGVVITVALPRLSSVWWFRTLGHEMLGARSLHDGSPVGGVAVCKVASRRNGNAGGWLGWSAAIAGSRLDKSLLVAANGPTPFDVGLPAVNAGTARGFPG